MIRKILVYEDAFSNTHPALERALQLARSHNSRLKIIDVVEGPTNALRELHRPMRSLVEQERKDQLDAICQPLHEQDIEFTIELIRGRPFVEIVREVVHEGFHLVVKAASVTPSTEIMGMMSSVDMRLVRNCPCPVWIEAPGRGVRLKRIMVAVDPQADDGELNEVLLRMATLLAKPAEAELHIVSAWEVPDEDFLVEKMHADKMARYVGDLKMAAQESLKELLVAGGEPVAANNVHFRKGRPAKTIVECLEVYQPDLLVIGTVGQSNISGLLIGNTADTVLRQINCSVLAVKPDSLFRA